MQLKKITLEMEDAYNKFIKGWTDNNEEVTPYSARLLGRTFKQFVDDAYLYETNPPEGWVKGTTLYLVDNNTILGAINLRYELNDFLMKFGGNIGYGVAPTYRQKGYASKMLEMCIPHLQELGLKKVLITCDDQNKGSIKVIENNGGVLENIVEEEERLTRRYWISLNK